MSAPYRPGVRRDAARILLGDAEMLDGTADFIADTHMTRDEAIAYLRNLARQYRRASQSAAAGQPQVWA